ncbi:uncharacterized protein LODBEIA_P38880 [Lodderomyces beijingensis]|uniref:OTU domain-containing protein n=1 Tax=Lodderomyces beijingensis TaxID=1775926 RepID=A0ABP0ZP36_9ASCO
MEELIQRHKKENKDLIATITGLKKQATKKSRKSVLEKCQELDASLKKRHAAELAMLNESDDVGGEEKDDGVSPEQLLAEMSLAPETPSDTSNEASHAAPCKRRNRQKERLDKRKAEIEKMQREAREEALNTTDYRQIEIDSMNQLLSLHNLELHEIKPDGHCLFAAIEDQLRERHHIQRSIQELRDLASDHILANQDDFVPFLFDETTCKVRDVDNYCSELRTTAMWGSDMEVLALARIFHCCVTIHMAGAPSLKINESEGEQEPELQLGYYKHSYGLGEHYNSLRDKKKIVEPKE